MIILKVTKNQSFTLSLEDTFFKKSQGEGVKLNPRGISRLTAAASAADAGIHKIPWALEQRHQ